MPSEFIDELEQRIYSLIRLVINEFVNCETAIENQYEYDNAVNNLMKSLLDAFVNEYEQINDHQLYKNIFLAAIRSQQDELLKQPGFINVLFEVRQLHSQSNKTQAFFETILLYCKRKNRADVSEVISYLIHLSAVWDGWHLINGYYLKQETMQEKTIEKKTLTPEQKNLVFQTLIEKEDVGTLDGEEIAKELGANVKYVMSLIKDLERREFIEYIGMAQYYFQVNVTADGIDFFNAGGFVAELGSNKLGIASRILNSATFGDNASIIIGSGNVQHIQNTVKQGDFAALQKTLENNGVSNDDIRELREVIDNDSPKIDEKRFGQKVGDWVKKMLGKSIDATWKVGISSAGKILADAIEQYYGMK